MQSKKADNRFLIRLETDEEVMTSLRAWAEEQEIGFAALYAIGALCRAKLAYFDAEERAYRPIVVEEQVEVLSLLGNISRGEDSAPLVHAHVILGRANGTTLGGHLVEGVVRPTLEVVLTVFPGKVQRQRDPASGLALWDLGASTL